MKLIVVLSITEYREQVTKLLHEAGVTRFSLMDITGYKRKKERVALNWFGTEAEAKVNSILMFSFASEEVARNVIRVVDTCNGEARNPFPVHAFMLDVEQYSKFF
ncbi:hypothetical protein JN06_01837 [Bacteroides zoogleoformans]|uniref:Nitrogen regulatory protein P-II family n=1 Tax=Bacteroides zoogleoformans TaxID=28119 RepID=A0ABN5IL41_9BACE|nr:hypothetical protein [Bacteroides zoogleoformans]AVM53589.1 hypothetical protein C4H11_12190 [Bacteroides zoogleoformans]TWJ13586.1 hypothetical protein JN06_01837 [Bacteroides zoogleoformans]